MYKMNEEIKVSELPEAQSVGGDEIIPVVQDGANKYVKAKNIKTGIVDNLTSNSTTYALSAKQGKVLADMIKKSIICAYPDVEDHLITADNQVVDLQISDSVGTKFTLENNGIKVGAGVNKVLVSGAIYLLNFDVTSSGYILIGITLNDSHVAQAIEPIVANGSGFQTVNISEMLKDVQEGDVIKMAIVTITSTEKGRYIGKDGSGNIRTYLTVKEVS